MIRWEVSFTCGEYDPRLAAVLDQVAQFKLFLIEHDLPHTFNEERDGRPAIEQWGGKK